MQTITLPQRAQVASAIAGVCAGQAVRNWAYGWETNYYGPACGVGLVSLTLTEEVDTFTFLGDVVVQVKLRHQEGGIWFVKKVTVSYPLKRACRKRGAASRKKGEVVRREVTAEELADCRHASAWPEGLIISEK